MLRRVGTQVEGGDERRQDSLGIGQVESRGGARPHDYFSFRGFSAGAGGSADTGALAVLGAGSPRAAQYALLLGFIWLARLSAAAFEDDRDIGISFSRHRARRLDLCRGADPSRVAKVREPMVPRAVFPDRNDRVMLEAGGARGR
jgi:hypothetical protein